MKFDTPATTNPIDQLKVVGKPFSEECVDALQRQVANAFALYVASRRNPVACSMIAAASVPSGPRRRRSSSTQSLHRTSAGR